MIQDGRELLWQIIKKNMGDNSLSLFQEFYKGDSIEEQFHGAAELFTNTFGREQTQIMLQPLENELKERV